MENHSIFTSRTTGCSILLLCELVTKLAPVWIEQDEVPMSLCVMFQFSLAWVVKTSPEPFETEWDPDPEGWSVGQVGEAAIFGCPLHAALKKSQKQTNQQKLFALRK